MAPTTESMAKPTSAELDREWGVRLHGMPFAERFPEGNVIYDYTQPTVKQLVEMRRTDGQARALYRLLTMPVRMAALRAQWIPAEGGEKEAELAKNILTLPRVSGGMRTPFARVVGQLLLSVFDGFAPFELVYTVPKRGPLKGKFALDKIAYRPSETVQFVVSDEGDFEGIRQRTISPGGKFIDTVIPEDHSIYMSVSEEENPFYGVSYFNAAFYHYDKKVKLYYLAHLAAQHRAVGSRLGKYPTGASPTEINNFRKALADFGLAQSVTVPDKGFTVEDLGKQLGDFPFMDFINHHNSQMSKSVLAPFLDDAQGGPKSAVDFGGQSDSMYMTLINVVVSEMENLINDWLMPRFIDWNFGSEKYPRIKFGPFSEEQKQAIKETFDKLSGAGMSANVTRPFLLELERYMAGEMGFEIDYKKLDQALEKQTDLTLKHFQQELAPPPQMPPFQSIGAVPPDKEPGVPPRQQWMPFQPVFDAEGNPVQGGSGQSNPTGPGVGMPSQGGYGPGRPATSGQGGGQKKPPRLPSQLRASGEEMPAESTMFGVSRSDATAIAEAMDELESEW